MSKRERAKPLRQDWEEGLVEWLSPNPEAWRVFNELVLEAEESIRCMFVGGFGDQGSTKGPNSGMD